MSHDSYLTHLYGLPSGPWSMIAFILIADISEMAGPVSKLGTESLDETFWSLK